MILTLTIRTDNPEAEVGLFNDDKQLAYETWQAHRELSATIHQKIKDMLDGQKNDWKDIKAIICFKGPGSFTGLRIGLTVANALADGLDIPIVGAVGNKWIKQGLADLKNGKNETVVLPEYGQDVHITTPRK